MLHSCLCAVCRLMMMMMMIVMIVVMMISFYATTSSSSVILSYSDGCNKILLLRSSAGTPSREAPKSSICWIVSADAA